jgi:hypothetical protein
LGFLVLFLVAFLEVYISNPIRRVLKNVDKTKLWAYPKISFSRCLFLRRAVFVDFVEEGSRAV